MITLEEAKAIADTRLEDITICLEMADAYIFKNQRTDYSIGGPDSPVIVLKEDGKIIPSVEYYGQKGSGELVATIKYVTSVNPVHFTPDMFEVDEEWEK